jgi:hypothetical protein
MLNYKQTTILGLGILLAVFLTKNPTFFFIGIFVGMYLSKRIEKKQKAQKDGKI